MKGVSNYRHMRPHNLVLSGAVTVLCCGYLIRFRIQLLLGSLAVSVEYWLCI